jgi:crossover junction endodeoxyribonuclease RusA
VRLNLPYPAKALWPNGRAHFMAKAREVKKHRAWAWAAAKASPLTSAGDGPLPIRLIVHGKPTGPLPDRDGAVGACKSYLDGISDALGINDRHFAAPTVEFAPERTSRFVIEVGHG